MPRKLQKIIDGEVGKVKAALHALEQKLEAGKIQAGLEGFRDALDSTRLSIWALLTAEKPAEYPSVLLCFRLQRGVELCQDISSDISNGISTTPAELGRFYSTLKATLKQLEPVVRT